MTLTRVDALALIESSQTRITRRVDIYEEDGATLWLRDAPVLDGSVNATNGDTVRRTMEITLDNSDFSIDTKPGQFWYDKVIKPYRGVRHPATGEEYEVQLGEFMIDELTEPNFPHTISAACRDYGKKLEAKFAYTTTYANQLLEELLRTLATLAGIPQAKMSFNITPGTMVGLEVTFERNSDIAEAMKSLAGATNHEVYFDSNGVLRVEPFSDPIVSERIYTFRTGTQGNLAKYTKKAHDTEIKNQIAVIGADPVSQLPIIAVATNTEPGSPTNVDELGVRYWEYENPLVTTMAQAQEKANSLLKVMSLESFEITMDAIVVPWLEVGKVIEFIDPRPSAGDPTAFLLDNFAIPLKVGTMSAAAKRITIVG